MTKHVRLIWIATQASSTSHLTISTHILKMKTSINVSGHSETMQDWEKALNKFLDTWRDKTEVIGALVCGSFVVGNPTAHSDIDVHILLKDGIEWRERGNQIMDGFLIEYFANPPDQIIEYFKEDFEARSQMAAIQFLTGRIVFDDGTIQHLKAEARQWYDRNFPEQPEAVREIYKYALWGALDDLQDAFAEEAPHFWFVYHNSLSQLIQHYCKFVGYPVIKERPAYGIFTDEKTRNKYLLPLFPEEAFQELITSALIGLERDRALNLYEHLTEHVLKQMAGFEIDGWKLRTPVTYDP